MRFYEGDSFFYGFKLMWSLCKNRVWCESCITLLVLVFYIHT